ncbi:hypothetical protein IW146_007009 [Coemansia sp. RSA 922]|nr:hypothetical protein H4S03_008190 [Coemansia sp. S3946]KAJ2108079.1 hypothetical protein IW146_007009 [Coemansia sp. RSA 922]
MSSNSAHAGGGRRADPYAASTPELLLSDIVPELLGSECRPRSWSTQSEAGLERRPPNRLRGPGATCGSPGRSSTFSGMSLPVATHTKAASIYSKSGGSAGSVCGSPDSQALRVQPRVATTSAGSSRPVMARGQIIAPQVRPRPPSSSGMRKQALSMMKPLVTLEAQKDAAPTNPSPEAIDAVVEPAKDTMSASPAESATASVTAAVAVGNASTAVDSASSHRTSASSRRGSCQSTTASDTDAAVDLLKNPRQRLSSKAGAVVGVHSVPNELSPHTEDSKAVAKRTGEIASQSLDLQRPQQQEELPTQRATWSTYSWLIRRASFASASQHTPDPSDSLRKSAIGHLRDIQGQQPDQLVSVAEQHTSGADDAAIPDEQQQQQQQQQHNGDEFASTINQSSEPTTTDAAAGGDSDLHSHVDTVSATGNVTESSSRWSWRWFGTSKSTAQPSLGRLDVAPGGGSSQPYEHTDSLHDPPPVSALESCVPEVDPVPTEISCLSEGEPRTTDASGQRPSVNMLVPDLDFESIIAVTSTAGVLPSESIDSSSDDGKHGDDVPTLSWRGQLHGLGKTLLRGAIAIAPDWARSAIQGHASADTLGQLDDGTYRSESPGYSNSQKIKSAMDVGAHKLGKIAVIGVHGWFPTRMLQMFSGEPTGKSEKFCVMMRDAIKEYLQDTHGIRVENSDISLFPLVGEGRIEDRVELLLSQITDIDEPADSQQQPASALDRSSSSSGNRPASSLGVTSPVAEHKPKLQTKASALANSSDPASSSARRSEMIAEVLMPERKRRAETLKVADTVFVVTHSQGTPVSAMLIERLIELELLEPRRQRIGMLAMAGISHGPLPYLKDNVVIKYIESEAARELFELMDPSSPQSQRYVGALSTILHKGVRLICIGSWVDEVVPLYSAIIQGVSHPNVYRAMYVDAHHYLDDFLTNLIVFALRLRNMGIYDHDLLTHLSEVVAGSLWGHSGHSTIYAEPAVYKLAIKWLLYSTSSVPLSSSALVPTVALGLPAGHQHAEASASGLQIHMSYRPFNAADRLNPFFIPWIMRTLWDEPEIRQNEGLRVELQRLVALFDKWAPETKAGKELKYRLEPVRAAL